MKSRAVAVNDVWPFRQIQRRRGGTQTYSEADRRRITDTRNSKQPLIQWGKKLEAVMSRSVLLALVVVLGFGAALIEGSEVHAQHSGDPRVADLVQAALQCSGL